MRKIIFVLVNYNQKIIKSQTVVIFLKYYNTPDYKTVILIKARFNQISTRALNKSIKDLYKMLFINFLLSKYLQRH